ncbi:uncharacterized protein A4U43_C10F4000 [Asparagus officinalis]|uniref:Uncharacterized protein n=1 Tax=Asparagus officinalis TaxID=4686 RepID=A0A5P1E3L0_ASPOF|nr:uncharacterized protein LOC109825955 [Asparagus officinalis]ONK56087.1 uncharacterized protein A4U43_C10F4000 [Asparagus officinalis]
MGGHLLDVNMEVLNPFLGYYHDCDFTVRPATELVQAGVSIKKAETESLNDISFSNGVLSLPCFNFNSYTTTTLLNYIAYEQMHRKSYRATYYAFLMDNIIDKAKDVTLLRQKGIITCWSGSDNEIASFFNCTTKELLYTFCTDETNVNEKLEEYCKKRWHRWRASFMQTYLSNPWVFISLIAAFILLFLTILQTLYTIMPYYNH